MEAWYENHPAAWAEVQKFATAPQVLGSMGILSLIPLAESFYVSPSRFSFAPEGTPFDLLPIDKHMSISPRWHAQAKHVLMVRVSCL